MQDESADRRRDTDAEPVDEDESADRRRDTDAEPEDEDESADRRRDDGHEQEGTIVFQSDVSGDIGLGNDPMALSGSGQDDGIELEELVTDIGDSPSQQSYA